MPFPEICVSDKEHRPNEWPTFLFNQNTQGCQSIYLHERNEHPLQITDNMDFVLTVAETRRLNKVVLTSVGVVEDAEAGKVKFCVDECDVKCRGLFISQIDVYETIDPAETSSSRSSESSSSVCPATQVDRRRIRSYYAYTEIAADYTDLKNMDIGVTIGEIRLAMRDISSNDNFLLDDVEYTDTEIAWAIRRPIDMWNESTPFLRGHEYTPHNFPFRYAWLNAVKGELMKMAAQNYLRNTQQYQAGGLTINDKDKYQQYEQLGSKYIQEYEIWRDKTKASINFQKAFGRISLRSYDNYPNGGGAYN
jgi:hypothetical protein